MDEEAKLNQKPCPNCGKAVDMDSRFCEYCAFDFTKSEPTQTTFTEMSSQHRICPNCGAMASANATFCNSCGKTVGSYQYSASTDEAKRYLRILVMVCGLLAIVGVVALLLSLGGRSRSTMVGNSYASNSSRSSFMGSGTGSESGKLTNAKVEGALNRLVSNLRVGGSISVEGIQEQQNEATADLRFNGFQYKSDQAGTPVTSDRQAPEEPKTNDPDFYDKVYKYGTAQVRTRTYSGRGTGTLTRYNDGRWVLKEIRWEFNGWAGSVDVQ